MNTAARILAAALTLALGVAAPAIAQTDDLDAYADDYQAGNFGRVRFAEGSITILRADGQTDTGDRAGVNAPIFPGDSLRTDSGGRAETTGEMIAKVRRLREREPRRVDAALEAMEEAARSGRAALETGELTALTAAVRKAEAALEAIEVVHPEVVRAIREIESAGGAAKVSGAGGCAGAGSGRRMLGWTFRSLSSPGRCPRTCR